MLRHSLGVVAGMCLASSLVGCAANPSPSPLTPESAAGQIHMSASASAPTFVATAAVADFGVEDGVRLVKVRIVEQMRLEVRIESAIDVVFAEDPRLCLVGPDSAPDDAGLEDRCWGEPDLTALVAGLWPRSAANQPMINAGQPLELSVQLERGTKRCDYPPGEWTLELKARPIVYGSPVEAMWAPDGVFQVPIGSAEPLLYLNDNTRYCGLATRVYQEQGEPQTVAP